MVTTRDSQLCEIVYASWYEGFRRIGAGSACMNNGVLVPLPLISKSSANWCFHLPCRSSRPRRTTAAYTVGLSTKPCGSLAANSIICKQKHGRFMHQSLWGTEGCWPSWHQSWKIPPTPYVTLWDPWVAPSVADSSSLIVRGRGTTGPSSLLLSDSITPALFNLVAQPNTQSL